MKTCEICGIEVEDSEHRFQIAMTDDQDRYEERLWVCERCKGKVRNFIFYLQGKPPGFDEEVFREVPKSKMWKFTWKDKKVDILPGRDLADALTQAGYGQGALPALDTWEEIA